MAFIIYHKDKKHYYNRQNTFEKNCKLLIFISKNINMFYKFAMTLTGKYDIRNVKYKFRKTALAIIPASENRQISKRDKNNKSNAHVMAWAVLICCVGAWRYPGSG